MNTDKTPRALQFVLILALLGCFLALYGISIKRNNLLLAEKNFQAEQTAKLIATRELASKGFPAPESEIVGYKYYSCDVVITDAWANGTNHYVLLMEVKRDGKSWRALPESRRFFHVKKRSNGHLSSLFSSESLLQSSSFSPRFFPGARLTNFSTGSNSHQAS